jgi:hypothetical protein
MPATPGTRSASDPEPCEDLCDFCLEVIEWIGNPDKSDWQREFEERAQSTCEFCEKIMRKPQQAVPENEASEKIVPLRMEVTRMSSRMQSDRDLYSWLHVQWIVAGWSPWKAGATEFALWTEKGKAQTPFMLNLLWLMEMGQMIQRPDNSSFNLPSLAQAWKTYAA